MNNNNINFEILLKQSNNLPNEELFFDKNKLLLRLDQQLNLSSFNDLLNSSIYIKLENQLKDKLKAFDGDKIKALTIVFNKGKMQEFLEYWTTIVLDNGEQNLYELLNVTPTTTDDKLESLLDNLYSTNTITVKRYQQLISILKDPYLKNQYDLSYWERKLNEPWSEKIVPFTQKEDDLEIIDLEGILKEEKIIKEKINTNKNNDYNKTFQLALTQIDVLKNEINNQNVISEPNINTINNAYNQNSQPVISQNSGLKSEINNQIVIPKTKKKIISERQPSLFEVLRTRVENGKRKFFSNSKKNQAVTPSFNEQANKELDLFEVKSDPAKKTKRAKDACTNWIYDNALEYRLIIKRINKICNDPNLNNDNKRASIEAQRILLQDEMDREKENWLQDPEYKKLYLHYKKCLKNEKEQLENKKSFLEVTRNNDDSQNMKMM